MRMKIIRLSDHLEKALLAGMAHGVINTDVVHPDELSSAGRAVLRAVKLLLAKGAIPPLRLDSVLLVITDLYGASPETVRAFLESIYVSVGASQGADEVLRRLREQHALLSVANAATHQLQQQEFHPSQIVDVLTAHASGPLVEPLAARLHETPPPVPKLSLASMPRFTTRVGGLIGLVAIAGEAGAGKTSLAWQWAIDAAAHLPVLYYDMENGFEAIASRTVRMFRDNLGAARDATQQLYLRDSPRTLESDLLAIRPPALLVVDSLQKLPTSVEHRRLGLDRWVHRLEGLKRQGYFVLLVSEVARDKYGAGPFIGSYKETGEVEYAADVGLQLINTGAAVELHVVKNRHGPFLGLAVTLRRDPERIFVWREASGVS